MIPKCIWPWHPCFSRPVLTSQGWEALVETLLQLQGPDQGLLPIATIHQLIMKLASTGHANKYQQFHVIQLSLNPIIADSLDNTIVEPSYSLFPVHSSPPHIVYYLKAKFKLYACLVFSMVPIMELTHSRSSNEYYQ